MFNFIYVLFVSVFLKHLIDFQDLIMTYIPRFVEKYNQNSISYLTNSFENFQYQINQTAQYKKANFYKLHKKLKVLHGHPQNKEALNNLSQEVIDFLDSVTGKINEAITPYEVKLHNITVGFDKKLLHFFV